MFDLGYKILAKMKIVTFNFKKKKMLKQVTKPVFFLPFTDQLYHNVFTQFVFLIFGFKKYGKSLFYYKGLRFWSMPPYYF